MITKQRAPHSAEATGDDAPRQSRTRDELIENLFREHNDTLIRFLRARLRSDQAARDVAQEAYVRLLSLEETGAVSYLRAFLFKIAENLAIDRLRREDIHERTVRLPLFHEFTDTRTPERQATAEQAVQRLERVIAALPVKCRRAFVLKRFEGHDVTAISEELNLSKRMVRDYIARALLQCRASLDLEPKQPKEPRRGKDRQ